MPEIKCPKCGEMFQIDESGYVDIVKQVRDKEFKREVENQLKILEESKVNELERIRIELEKSHDASLIQKDRELSEKDMQIKELLLQIENHSNEMKLALSNAANDYDKKLFEQSSTIKELEGKLGNKETESQLKEANLKEKYENLLKGKDEQIQYYKDLKTQMSTKMVGETLEQHCQTQFNQLRATGFQNAYFEKDNDAKTGSKGDFIFRDFDENNTEYISIMFEMKNEMDTTATKHKNEDFLKELDKDRNEKNCEYAVLVSLLEKDSELYNTGIVDVSYKYPKMYVIRPQFFIPMITLLRNAATNSLQYQRELQIVRNQQLDILHFEENMETFKKGFSKNYDLASRKYESAIAGIDKTIENLEKIKKELQASENNLRLANDKAQDLSIKALTKNAPSVREMFKELKK